MWGSGQLSFWMVPCHVGAAWQVWGPSSAGSQCDTGHSSSYIIPSTLMPSSWSWGKLGGRAGLRAGRAGWQEQAERCLRCSAGAGSPERRERY